MNKNFIYIIIFAVALLLSFLFGKCSESGKVIYKEKLKDSIRYEIGYLGTKIDTLKVNNYKAKFYPVHDTIYIKDSAGHISFEVKVNNYANLDTTLQQTVTVTQNDTLNSIDTTSCSNLSVYLNVKFRFNDSTFHAVIVPKLDRIPFVTKTIIHYTEIPLHWTRSDWFIYSVGLGGFVGGVYIGSNAK